jgi:uncharacterized protein YneF (UPF0154 family)
MLLLYLVIIGLFGVVVVILVGIFIFYFVKRKKAMNNKEQVCILF